MTEIKDGRKIITTPITDEDIKGLRASESFYLSGDVLTGRDEVHARVVAEGRDFPSDIKGKALFHAGPIVKEGKDGDYEIVSIGPTTSMRMEKFEKEFIRKAGVKLIIGKGGMGSVTADACREFAAVHCAAPAGCAVACAVSATEVSEVSWLDLGMPEAVWYLKVSELGPLIVTIDSEGNNYFEEKKRTYNARKDEQIEKIIRKMD